MSLVKTSDISLSKDPNWLHREHKSSYSTTMFIKKTILVCLTEIKTPQKIELLHLDNTHMLCNKIPGIF